MNRFCVVFFVALASTTFAEPPSESYGLPSLSSTYGLPSVSSSYGLPSVSSSYGLPSVSSSYGLPSVSSGYDYQPSGYNYEPKVVSTSYVKKNVGRIPSEGYNLDHHLLHEIKGVLIDHENSGNNKVNVISTGYGVPQSQYGPPSHWTKSSRVVGLDFGHLQQSLPVAYYLGTDRYASGHASSGWNAGNSGWSSGNSGWKADNLGWKAENLGWKADNSGWKAEKVGWSADNSGWKADNLGWKADNSGWKAEKVGWSADNSGWKADNSGWNAGSSGWLKPSTQIYQTSIPHTPRVTYGAPSSPSISYGVPSW